MSEDARIFGATTTAQERAGGRFQIAGAADAIVARCKHWADICSRVNSQTCSQQRLRLYRKATGSSKGRVIKGNRLKWLRGGMGVNPGTKAVQYADEDDVIEVVDHPVLDLLRNPNPWMGGHEFSYLRFKAMEAAGNSYTFVYDTSEAYFLSPQFMRIVSSETEPISGYVWTRNRQQEFRIDPDMVMHQRLEPSLETPWIGSSPIMSVILALDLYEAAMTSEMARWINGGAPLWVAKLPQGTDPNTRQEVRDYLRSEFRGPGKAGNFLVTSNVDIENPGLSNRDMQYRDGMDMVARMTWASYGIPESVMELNDANLASSQTGNVQYMRQTILPRVNGDAHALSEYLLPLYGIRPGDYWFAYDNPVPEDVSAKIAQSVSLVSSGILTVNEVRAEMGWEGVGDAGDVLRVNGIEVGKEMGNEDGTQVDQEQGPVGEDAGSEDDAQEQEDARPAGEVKRKEAPTSKLSELGRKVRGWFDKVRDGLKVLPGGVLELPPGAAMELDSILGSALADIFKNGLKGEFEKAGTGFDVVPVRALAALDHHRALVIEQVMNTTMKGLRDTVKEGLASGVSIPELADAVRGQIDETYDWRAENIARTESANAYGAGRNAAFVELDFDKTWELAGGPCPMCEGFALHVQCKTFKATEPFCKAGETWIGTDGKPYMAETAIMHEPLHPSCRCTTVGVLSKDGGE